MLRRWEQRLGEIARRKGLSILLTGLTPLVLRLILLPVLPMPNPRVQDEFSHLLVADTFAHGRIVNPVHPMWVHFESMHMVVRPVYASVFPVAQGIVMATAQVLTGNPWLGVFFSAGLMCAALCWMLQGWVSPGWALLGGMLAAIRYGVLSYWMNSYYGGAVAALAGALVLGALPRLVKRGRWRDAVWMGLGLAILANSRPYEGLLFGVPVVAAAIWELRRKQRRLTVLLPLVLILGATAIALGAYCARFSGNPFQLPYAFYRSAFTVAPHFVWQSPRPEPVYLHRILRRFHTEWEMRAYNYARTNLPPYGILDKALDYGRFYLGPFLALALLTTLPWLWKRRHIRFLVATAILFSAGLAVQVWHAPQYAAPATGLALLLSIEALRQCRAGLGPWAVRFLVLACLLTPIIGGGIGVGDGNDRARILKQLESTGKRHLVLVRYSLAHDVGDEWVYNSADIDSAPVVWAREMDPTSNRELLRYFQGRRAWLVQPDTSPVTVLPFDPSLPPDPPFRFVRLGTEAITVLRSPEEVREKVLRRVALSYSQPYRLNCDQWNYFFTAVTGVEGADLSRGCFPPGNRGQTISFDDWFAWLQKQK